MGDINFQKLFENLQEEAKELAVAAFKKLKKEAEDDALGLLDRLKENLKNWTVQLANGELSKEDFEFLVLAQKELIEMNALKQAGQAAIRIDELKGDLLNLIVSTVSALL